MKRNTIKRFSLLMSTSIIVAFSLFAISLPLWTRPIIAVGFESLASVLAGLCLSALFFQYRNTPKNSFLWFIFAIGYYALTEMGGAIEKHFEGISPILQKTSFVLASDILQVLILGIFLSIGSFVEYRKTEDSNTGTTNMVTVISFLAALAIHGIARLQVFPMLDSQLLLLIATLLAIGSIAFLSATCFFFLKGHRLFEYVKALRVVGAMFLLALSVVFSWLAMATDSSIWILTICFQIVAFFTIYIAFSIPLLRRYESEESKSGEIFTNSVAGFIISLLFLTMIVELGWPHIIYYEVGVALLAQIGSTFMSITITLFTMKYAIVSGKRYLYPIIFVYSLWTITGVAQAFYTIISAQSQIESLVFELTASLLSIPAIALSVVWMKETRIPRIVDEPRRWVILGLLVGGSLMTIGVGIRSNILSSSTWDPTALGRALMLVFCLTAIMLLVLLSFILFQVNHGSLLLDSISVAFLSIWFIPGLLKGNFATWTIGWWLSEAVILLGLFIAPGILGYMYLESSLRAQQSETRAKVYADVLAHDISNHHQIILNTIELVLMESTPDFIKEKNLTDAYRTLLEADRLVRNVRKLGNLEVLAKSDFKPYDLIQTITSTFDMITRIFPNQTMSMKLEQPYDKCEILANDLLPDIFQNLLLNAVEYSKGEIVEIEISQKQEEDVIFWQVRISDHGPGIHPNVRESLFTRYMKGAQGSGLGLSLVKALTDFFGGSITVEDRILGDYKEGSCFILIFPAFLDGK